MDFNSTKRPRGRPRGTGKPKINPTKMVDNRGAKGHYQTRLKPDELRDIAEPETAQERLSIVTDPEMGETAKELLKPIMKRKGRMACLGIPSYILDEGDQEYAKAIRAANLWKKQRIREYFIAHGHVSTGVHSLLASAALSMAASRFIYALATRGEVDPHRMKLASSLSDSSRQNELAAWELCQREAVIQKRNDAGKISMPWVVAQETGMIKSKMGRPRKALQAAEVTIEELNHAGYVFGEAESNGTSDSGQGGGPSGEAASTG